MDNPTTRCEHHTRKLPFGLGVDLQKQRHVGRPLPPTWPWWARRRTDGTWAM
jgi:hypothetical protein